VDGGLISGWVASSDYYTLERGRRRAPAWHLVVIGAPWSGMGKCERWQETLESDTRHVAKDRERYKWHRQTT
jgi:hypothetical protein